MAFNSFAYLVFFTSVVAVYFSVPHRFRWIVVLIASYFFYMAWKPIYGLLLLSTTGIDWFLALWMSRFNSQAQRKKILVLSLIMNLSILFFFKYFNFVTISLWEFFNFRSDPLLLQVVLPIGISFYTFQSIAYMVDVYRGDLPAERNVARYAAFVSFFPHLVSGPILRPANIIPQLHEEKRWDPINVKSGLFLIGLGLFKKIIIADRLSFFVNSIYNAPGSHSGASLLLATYFFAFQIYCDFAGYTDIAIGSARILGYRIPENFRQPYFSQSIPEFWRRWHISLSTWLKDYLYIPLGGSRNGGLATYRNLMITMLLGGLWHGAAWTFIIWGFLHGLFLSLSKLTITFRDKVWASFSAPPLLISVVRIVITFNLVCFAWIFFRVGSLELAWVALTRIFTHFGSLDSTLVSFNKLVLYMAMIVALVVFDYFEVKNGVSQYVLKSSWILQWGLALLLIFIFILFGVQQGPAFIYFQF